jgi:hypothetical protein
MLAKQPSDRSTGLLNVPSSPQPERTRVAALPPTAPEATDKLTPTATVHEVLPSQPDGSAPGDIIFSDPSPITSGAQRRTITVIYKPGNRLPPPAVPDRNDGLLSKTLSFLEDVKQNGPTYSELRLAKSTLIDNVLSRDQNNQQ